MVDRLLCLPANTRVLELDIPCSQQQNGNKNGSLRPHQDCVVLSSPTAAALPPACEVRMCKFTLLSGSLMQRRWYQLPHSST
jgi:hypothetical protein